jgi:hypothetical protein
LTEEIAAVVLVALVALKVSAVGAPGDGAFLAQAASKRVAASEARAAPRKVVDIQEDVGWERRCNSRK